MRFITYRNTHRRIASQAAAHTVSSGNALSRTPTNPPAMSFAALSELNRAAMVNRSGTDDLHPHAPHMGDSLGALYQNGG